MGLFSSSQEIQVNTSVSRVIPDNLLPNAIKTGVFLALNDPDGNGDITDYVLEEIVSSVGVRAERMYDYAKLHYTHGLPSGQFLTANEGIESVTAVLTALEGNPVTVLYSHLGAPNYQHIVWMKLMALYGYNPVTNQLVVAGATVYLDNLQVIVPSDWLATIPAEALERWGPSAYSGLTPLKPNNTSSVAEMIEDSLIVLDALATVVSVKVTYAWSVTTMVQDSPVETFSSASLLLPITGYDALSDYFQVKYTCATGTKYWIYRHGATTYPTLDAVFNAPSEVLGTFFPFLYFRINKASTTADNTTAAYLTSKKMCKYLGMDYDAVADSINSNPGIADVEQAMIMMAVPADTTNPVEQRYLYTFFDSMYYSDEDKIGQVDWVIGRRFQQNTRIKRSLIIQDAQFKMALINSGISKNRKAGVLGKIGTYTSEVLTHTETEQYQISDGEIGNRSVIVKSHCYRYQVSDVLYDEIIVTGLRMVYKIWNRYTTVGNINNDFLLVPIDRAVSEDFSSVDREILYSRSLHYIFNSLIITEVEWYESFFFQFLILAAAVFLTVISLGKTWKAIVAAVALGTTTYTWAILTLILKTIVVSQLVSLFVQAVGFKAAFIIAIIAMVTAGYMAFEAGSITGAPWAQELLALGNNLIGSANQVAMNDLLEEATLFQSEVDKETTLLKTAQELLEDSPTMLPMTIFGESPSDFYKRTTHYGNIGTIGIDAIHSYVSNSLKLPTINDTLGDYFYGQQQQQ